MSNQNLFSFVPGIIVTFSNIIAPSSAEAQITIDGTTDTNLTTTDNGITIDDGDRNNGNLFHSFQEFSVPTGREAFFNNSTDVINIFSRVTGGKISYIEGLLRSNGTANLFFINPAGIVFGANATLNVGGSFYGSTADSVLFPNDVEFAVSNPVEPILTVNAPIGLRFRDNSGDIVNKSLANDFGLTISPRQNFALIGGNITLEGGRITSFVGTGNIELASVADNSVVDLEPDNSSFTLEYNQVTDFKNITLNNDAAIRSTESSINLRGDIISLQNSSEIGTFIIGSQTGGNVNIQGRKLLINDNSNIVTTSFGQGNAGNINIAAFESITVRNKELFNLQNALIEGAINPDESLTTDELLDRTTGIVTGTQNAGNTGEINVKTSYLQLLEGGVLGGATNGSGDLASISIEATEALSIVGGGVFNNPLIGSSGNGNSVEITTKNLTISDGGLINFTTLGTGKGGDIKIVASEQINIFRTPQDSLVATGIFANTSFGNATAGNIRIDTKKLSLQDGGQITSASGIPTNIGILPGGGVGGNITINASESIEASGISLSSNTVFPSGFSTNTSTSNSAGNININTGSVSLTNGAQISARTTGQGRGGIIRINAIENLEIIGIETFDTGIFSSSEALSNGDAGGIRITTSELSIRDRGQISVSSEEQGDGGTLTIATHFLTLDHGFITADTNFGTGANVNLEIKNNLILDNDSLISAKAFNDAIDSGNVNINSSIILAFPSKKPNNGNDIIASAPEESGGNIVVTADAILGIQERPAIDGNGTNDIDATSTFDSNLDSDNRIVDTELSTANIIEPDQVVAQACQANQNISEKTNTFAIKGKGGIPPTPNLPLNAEVLLNSRKPIRANSPGLYNQQITNNIAPQIQSVKTAMGDIYPARGIILKQDGTVTLTAYATNEFNQRLPNNNYPKCSY